MPRKPLPQNAHPITVLVVEDTAKDARMILEALESDPTIQPLQPVALVDAAVSLAERHQPTVVLYDLHLGGRFRPDGIARIKAVSPKTLVLAHTHYEDTDLILEALRFGADGYLLKADASASLPTLLRRALDDDVPLSRSVARRILKHFRKPGGIDGNSPEPQLSPRQRQVVERVAEGRSNKEIAGLLGISIDAVKLHVAATKRKLHVASRPELAGWFAKRTAP